MFIVSKRTQYSLRALYHLSRAYGGTWVTTSRISETEGIPKKFLEAILVDLKAHGFVNSKPGPGGGHQLARPPCQIGLGSAVRAIDGPLSLLPCANEITHRTCSECANADDCGTRFVMQRVVKATARILDEMTLADVCDFSRLHLVPDTAKLAGDWHGDSCADTRGVQTHGAFLLWARISECRILGRSTVRYSQGRVAASPNPG